MRRRNETGWIAVSGAALLALTGTLANAGDGTKGTVGHVADGTVDAAQAALTDAPLGETRVRLLELAYDTASAIPHEPHVKDRSRAQERVVVLCLELDQPERAVRYADGIDNWRRGSAYGDIAFYYAERGRDEQARAYAVIAADVSGQTDEWRRDRIRVKVARTHARLGDDEHAAQFEQGVTESEVGKVDIIRARDVDGTSFVERLAALDEVTAVGSFDLTRNALGEYVELYERFYDDETRRELIRTKIGAAWRVVPFMVRLEVLADLAEIAIAKRDPATTITLIDRFEVIMQEHQWVPSDHVALLARLAVLRQAAGQVDKARVEASAALAMFDAKREQILMVDRATTLLEIAEAYHALDDETQTLATYTRSVEEAASNPNARPRAIDLSAVGRSMARHDVEPSVELWSRLRQLREGLGHPW